MEYTVKADLSIKDSAGAEYRLPSSHTVTYWLVQNHGPEAKTKPWLIDGYQGTYHIDGTPLPAKK